MNLSLSRALALTVVWDRPVLARHVLAELTVGQGKCEVGSRPEVRPCTPALSARSALGAAHPHFARPSTAKRSHYRSAARVDQVAMALQRALELRRSQVVEVLLKLPGIDTSGVNMGRLFIQPDDLRYLRNNRLLQACHQPRNNRRNAAWRLHRVFCLRLIWPHARLLLRHDSIRTSLRRRTSRSYTPRRSAPPTTRTSKELRMGSTARSRLSTRACCARRHVKR